MPRLSLLRNLLGYLIFAANSETFLLTTTDAFWLFSNCEKALTKLQTLYLRAQSRLAPTCRVESVGEGAWVHPYLPAVLARLGSARRYLRREMLGSAAREA